MSSNAKREFSGNHRFRVLRRLGSGGMGVVYEAEDVGTGARVALKTLRALTADSLLLFKQEFRVLQGIEHANLISLGELIGEGDDWFFTMELVEGQTFLEHVRPRDAPPAEDDRPTMERPIGYAPVELEETSPAAAAATPRRLDEARLRAALPQLVRGLMALHAAGKIHRDIKPSNVLVDPSGRVVILDFGLAVDHARAPQIDALSSFQPNRSIAGTIDYMSPEQASGQPLGPECDWYAVGVMLYEALTGDVPFHGDPMQILLGKQRNDAPPPRARTSADDQSVPADLDALCAELLRFSPGARPTGPEILERLGERGRAERAPSADSHSLASRFVGREEELERLRDAFERAEMGNGSTAFVSGESGVGKSALVSYFLDDVRARQPGLVVLTGRCYERESVPYKAVDGVVDSLSRHMVRLPKTEAQAILPVHAALLTRVFPVLSRVEAFAEAPQPKQRIRDLQELRGRVFAAMRELLRRLTQRTPLIIVIDDLQWADADSLSLLAEVLRPPDPPPLLLVVTLRPTPTHPSPSALAATIPGPSIELPLAPLAPEEAQRLATQIIGLIGAGHAVDANAIASEAAGHPLFIDALIRHALAPRAGQQGPLQLEDAFRARVLELDEPTRRLLEVIAVAGGPMQQQTVAQAAALGTDFPRRLGLLRVAHLVRTTGSRGTDRVETYHDRVRAALVPHLDPAVARGHHQRIAVALETASPPDPELLVVHWREAGVAAKAAHYAILAAQKAESALAFERAAQLYQLCLELDPPQGTEAERLRAKLADALANAGRGAEAAAAYLDAAAISDATAALDMRRRAAEQLLRSGHVEQGTVVLKDVLASVGLGLAETPRRALASLLLRRAHFRLRGLRYKERSGNQVTADKLTRIDTCWSAAMGFSMIDTIRGADFQTRHLLLALEAGEPYRVARALSMEAALVATGGAAAGARAAKLHAEAAALSERLGHPHAVALAKLASGVLAFQLGKWGEANRQLSAAITLLRESCTGVAWELSSANVFRLGALFYLGEFDELTATVPALIQEGEARGDLYATTNLRLTHMNSAWLAADDADAARSQAAHAIQAWPATGFLAQHYYDLFAQTNIDLYVDRGEAAWERIEAAWRALERSLFLRVQVVRIEAYHLRARAALGQLRHASDRRPLEASIEDSMSRLRGEKLAWSDALALLLEGALAASRDRRPAALTLLEQAAEALARSEMQGYALAARRAAAALAGGSTAEIDAALRRQRVRRPDRLARMLVPGLPS